MSSNEQKREVLAERLKKARLRKGLKQIQVFERVGINNKTLSGYENGVSEPDIQTLNDLASLYEVPLSYLLGDEQTDTDENERILKEIVRQYNLDLTVPGTREKLEQIIQIVLLDYKKNQS